jgi:hypothetical protein
VRRGDVRQASFTTIDTADGRLLMALPKLTDVSPRRRAHLGVATFSTPISTVLIVPANANFTSTPTAFAISAAQERGTPKMSYRRARITPGSGQRAGRNGIKRSATER